MFSAGKSGGVKPTDPYFQDVTLLLTGDGTNGAQNNTFLDSSTNNFTITRNGNTTQGSFSPYGNLWSNYLASSANNCLRFGTSTNLALGAGDFTVEFWLYLIAAAPSYTTYVDWRTNGNTPANIPILLDWNNNGKMAFVVGTGSGFTTVLESASTVPLNTWTHVALVRSGTSVTLYWNGASVATGTSSVNFGIETFSISNPQASNYNPNAYFSNFRIVKGTAVYTSAFTPSTTPLTAISGTSLLTCQSNRFIDNSSNNFALTVNGTPSVQRFSPFQPTSAYSTSVIGGSMYDDGNGDYLYKAAISLSGNWTIEGFFYFTSASGSSVHVVSANNGGSGAPDFIGGFNSSNLGFYLTGWVTSGVAFPLNQWCHIATVNNSGTVTMYLNGVSICSGTGYGSYTYNGELIIGSYFNRQSGYYSNIRFSTIARYTSTFTPSTAPFVSDANTYLLLNMTNAGIPDAAMMNDLETVGNAQVSTTVKKYGTGSLSFDGTGDYIVSPTFSSTNAPSALYSPNGAFTVECWINPTDRSSRSIVGYGTGSTVWVLQFDGSNHVQFKWANTVPTVYTAISTSTISTGAWTHIAATYDGSNIRIFVNGTLEATTATSGTLRSISSPILGVGSWGGSFGDPTYYGYIDDLRITNGYARYTANFTPPTAALPTY